MPPSPWDFTGNAELLSCLSLLSSVPGFGRVTALEAWRVGLDPDSLLERPELLPVPGSRASRIIDDIRRLSRQDRERSLAAARAMLASASAQGASLMGYDHPHYPRLVRESSFPCPILWAAGNVALLGSHGRRALAAVGSRTIRPRYAALHAIAARVAAAEQILVVSGFALGADTVGHREALGSGGATLAVLPCGLDQVFPPENHPLWREILDSGRGVLLTSFPLGTRADALHLRIRNRLIVAAAAGVLVSQSRVDGGSMIAYRAAVEQKKPVATFAPDGTDDTSGNAAIAADGRNATTCLPADASGLEGRFQSWCQAICGGRAD
jgi:DNA processing protein